MQQFGSGWNADHARGLSQLRGSPAKRAGPPERQSGLARMRLCTINYPDCQVKNTSTEIVLMVWDLRERRQHGSRPSPGPSGQNLTLGVGGRR